MSKYVWVNMYKYVFEKVKTVNKNLKESNYTLIFYFCDRLSQLWNTSF